jgi:acyl carrier protein
VALMMGLPATELPAINTGLTELGLDSLMAIEFRSRIGREIGRRFPPTLLFDYPSLDALGKFLEHELLGPDGDSFEDGRSDDLLRLLDDIDRPAT